jgi:hypothetical protein
MLEKRYHYISAYTVLSVKNDYSMERVYDLHGLHGIVKARIARPYCDIQTFILKSSRDALDTRQASRERFYRETQPSHTRDNDRRYGLRRYQGETSRLKARGSGARGGCIPRSR